MAAGPTGKRDGKPAEPLADPAGFFALRTPLLPLEELHRFGAGLSAPATPLDDGARLEAALLADRATLRSRLRAQLDRPEVQEALFVASPSLHESLPEWLERPESERGQKVERSLVRYFQRMAARPTPFGLFAGCSTALLGEETRLEVAARGDYQRHTRLDMDYLFALSERLPTLPGLRGALRYHPNSSLYRAAGRLRYAEARVEGRNRSYHLVAVEPSDYLEATLARAAGGALPSELAKPLVDDEITIDDAREFVEELIAGQILVSELEASVTGPEPIHRLLDALPSVPEAEEARRRLSGARDTIAAIDRGGLGNAASAYRAVAAELEPLPVPVELPRLFQVDLHKPAPSATLGRAVVDELLRAVTALWRISTRHDPLQSFREAFSKRFEDREVPFVEALDEEAGVTTRTAAGGEASPLLDGLAFPGAPGEATVPWGARQAMLLRKLESALATGAREVQLTDGDLEPLRVREPAPLPDSFAAMGTLLGDSRAIAEGRYRIALNGIVGPSGVRLFGRFCHGDPRLTELVRAHLAAEAALQPDAIFAEIVHLPEGRIGNVLLRPVLRDWEIPFLAASAVPTKNQIPVTDLLLSVRGAEVVLRSARLGRRVIPRLTTAHNYSAPRNLGFYRFLCQLQEQGVAGVHLGWSPFDGATFQPRLVHGRVVLQPARWTLRADRLKPLGEATGAARFCLAQKLRSELALPRWVAVEDFDNELPVDFDNVLSVETFVHLVKGRAQLKLVEMELDAAELGAHGPEGRFTHEIVVPFLRRRELARPAVRPTWADRARPRSLAPGSEWLYARLYTGTASADEVLRALRPILDAQTASGACDRWFFIRYADPEHHLRLRLHGDPSRLALEARPALDALALQLLDGGLLQRIEHGTYEREMERYGGLVGVELAERLFHHDSEAVLSIVELLSGDEAADARWRLTLVGMDRMLDDLGYDAVGKRAVMEGLRSGYAREFRFDQPAASRQLGDRYRKERLSLEALLDPVRAAESDLQPGLEIFDRRGPALRAIGAELRAAASSLPPLDDLVGSYLHMHANRLLRGAARAQEMVIYDLLARIYEGRAKRKK